MAAELRLGVSFDLVYFRQQLQKLGRIAASEFTAPIKIKLDRRVIDKELNDLQRLIKRRKYNIELNIAGNLSKKTFEDLQARLDALSTRKKVEIPVSIKNAATAKDVNDTVIGIKARIAQNQTVKQGDGKIRIGTSIKPSITNADVADFRRVVQAKLSGISVKVKADIQGGFASGPTGLAGLQEYMRTQGLSGGNMPGAAQTGRRTQFEAAVAQASNRELQDMMRRAKVQGRSSIRSSAAMRERLMQLDDAAMESVLGNLQMNMNDPRRVKRGFLDQVARAVFWMAGVDPEYLKRQAAQRRALPGVDFPATVPPSRVSIGPSGTGRALPAGAIPGALPGTAFGARGFLPPQIGQDLQNILRNAAFTFVDSLNARIRQVNVREIGRQALPPSMIRGLLPSAVGRTPATYGGPADRGSFIQNRIAQAYARSALRGASVMAESPQGFALGAGGGGPAGPYRPFDRPQRGGALAQYQQPSVTRLSSELPPNYFQTGRLASGIRGLGADFNQAKLPLSGAVRELGDEFATATKQVLLYGTAYKALAFFASLPGQAFEAAKALQTINNQLEAVTGSASNADRSFAFIDNLANRFNVPLASARDGFVKLYASMEPAGFSGSEIEGLFEGISKATATFGLSADQVDRVNYAFAQMASKGQIMSEELKGQLGDVLPGSLALFARAAQMSIPEFSKAMEDGAFKGEAMAQVLRNVAKIMNSDFGGAAANAANTLQGALNGMQNSVQRLYEAFEPVVNAIASQAFPIIEEAVASATEAVKAFGATIQGNDGPANMLEGNARGIYDAMQSVQEVIVAVGRVIQGLAPTFTIFGQLILTVADSISRVINTKFGGFLADLAVKVGIGMIAVQAFSRVMGFQLVASLITAAQSARTFTGSIAAMGTALRTSTVAARAFRLALTGLVVGGVLMGIEALVGVIGKLANRLRDARNRAVEAREAIKSMGASELSTEQRKISQAQQALSAAKQGGGRAMVTADQFEILKGYGLVDDFEKGSRVGKRAGKPTIEIKIDPSLVQSRELRLSDIRAETDRALKDLYFTPAAPDLETVDLAPGKEKKAKGKKERESQVPELQERLRLAKELLDIDMQIMEARLGGNDLAVNRLEYEKELLDIASKIRMVKLEDIPDAEKALKIEALRIDEQLAFEKLIAATKKGVIEDLQKQSDALQEIEQQSSQELQNTKRYEELLRNGVNPALAKATIEVENKFAKVKQEFDLKTKQIQLEIKELEALQNRTKEQEKYLEVLKEQLKLRGFAAEGIPGAQADEQARQQQLLQPKSNAVLAIEAYDEAKQRLTDLTNPVMALTLAAQGIGDAFAQSFSSIVTGAVSVKEGLRELFQNIGKMFIDMAAKMIAQWMVMKAIGLIGAMFGAGANPPMSQGGYYDSATGLGRAGPNFGLANGGIINGSFMPVTPFAKGGMVTGPTLGLVGEGRFNEAVVPLPDGRSIPVELGQGAGNNIATNITVNVSNGQAQSTMSGRGGTSLGRELDAAVKDVILRETRPGGIIYSSR